MSKNIVKFGLVLFFSFASFLANATNYTGTVDCLAGTISLSGGSSGASASLTASSQDNIQITMTNGSCAPNNVTPPNANQTVSGAVVTLVPNAAVSPTTYTYTFGLGAQLVLTDVAPPFSATAPNGTTLTINGTVGSAITTTNVLQGNGGTGAYQFMYSYPNGGTFPTGLSRSGVTTLRFSGTPTAASNTTVVVSVKDMMTNTIAATTVTVIFNITNYTYVKFRYADFSDCGDGRQFN